MRRLGLKISIYLILAFVLTSCASYFKRKECEKTDWRQYGKSVAMSGQRLTGDHFVASCEQAEAKIDYSALDVGFKEGMANYCLPETVFATGRAGKPFNPKMCDGSHLAVLNQKHKEGVEAFCQPDNGYRVGAEGWTYNNICPRELEKAFYGEYEKGRRLYLAGQVKQKEDEIAALDRQIKDNQKTMALYSHQLSTLPAVPPPRQPNGKDQPAYTAEEQRILNERGRLTSKISQLERQVRNDRNSQQKLRKELGDLKTQLTALQR